MSADVDIDFSNREDILKLIKHIPARQQDRHHNSGVYVTPIPYDPINRCASIDYKEAEDRGYFKIDFLNVHVYEQIKSPEHYEQLLQADIPWHRLQEKEFVVQLIHINNYYDLLQTMQVDTIERMAMFLALIRPSKKYLIGNSWRAIASEIWDAPEHGEYYFKKAHAVSYAHLVTLHMRILNDQHS